MRTSWDQSISDIELRPHGPPSPPSSNDRSRVRKKSRQREVVPNAGDRRKASDAEKEYSGVEKRSHALRNVSRRRASRQTTITTVVNITQTPGVPQTLGHHDCRQSNLQPEPCLRMQMNRQLNRMRMSLMLKTQKCRISRTVYSASITRIEWLKKPMSTISKNCSMSIISR